MQIIHSCSEPTHLPQEKKGQYKSILIRKAKVTFKVKLLILLIKSHEKNLTTGASFLLKKIHHTTAIGIVTYYCSQEVKLFFLCLFILSPLMGCEVCYKN